jgi:hypothetical protein
MVEFGAAPTAAAHSDGADASGRPASLGLLPGSTRQGFLEKRQVRTPCQICTYRTRLTPATSAPGLSSPLLT